jgi:hypothetical protein
MKFTIIALLSMVTVKSNTLLHLLLLIYLKIQSDKVIDTILNVI